jgi:hypothetical protein
LACRDFCLFNGCYHVYLGMEAMIIGYKFFDIDGKCLLSLACSPEIITTPQINEIMNIDRHRYRIDSIEHRIGVPDYKETDHVHEVHYRMTALQ